MFFSQKEESVPKYFRDRQEAGRELVQYLQEYSDKPDVLVLGLPRGGVVVAFEIAEALNLPLDVFIVRKLGTPFQPELAMGAIAEGGLLLLNDAVVNYAGISREVIESTAKEELSELDRRVKLYRNGRQSLDLKGKTVIIADDGLATGATMKVAVRAVRRKEPSKIVVAVPLGAPSTCLELREEAEEVICMQTPEPLMAVGAWYLEFDQTSDDEVRGLLQEAFDHYTKGRRR